MFEGTPVVATDLPGVRVPVQVTGYGQIAEIADSEDLAKKIVKTLQAKHKVDTKKIRKLFNKEDSVRNYLDLYNFSNEKISKK